MDAMHIIKIGCNPVCNGPLEFIIEWNCQNCGATGFLKKPGSLLPPETVECGKCAKLWRYSFPEEFIIKSQELAKLIEIEDAVYKAAYASHDFEIESLGMNFLFPIFAHFGNATGDRGESKV